VTTELTTWKEGAAKAAIVEFVEQTVANAVPVEERIAVFDADGTLWCEKPVPVELDFILRRLAEMAEADATLRDRQPWKSAYDHDNGWLSAAIDEHYAGNDAKAKTLLAGISSTYADIDVEDFAAKADAFLRGTKHPTLGRGYDQTAYAPMVELLAYLEANGFSNHMVSGSGADFMRPISEEMFGIPPERVIGSATVLEWAGGSVMRKAALGVLDDGPQKPIQIWSHLGRRPILAGGNSNGDIPMLDFTQRPDMPTLRLLLNHDDAEREFAYTGGAEKALEKAGPSGWTVASMRDDFTTVFAAGDAGKAPPS